MHSGDYIPLNETPRARAVRRMWRIEPGEYDPKLDVHAFGEKCEALPTRRRNEISSRCPHKGLGGEVRYVR